MGLFLDLMNCDYTQMTHQLVGKLLFLKNKDDFPKFDLKIGVYINSYHHLNLY